MFKLSFTRAFFSIFCSWTRWFAQDIIHCYWIWEFFLLSLCQPVEIAHPMRYKKQVCLFPLCDDIYHVACLLQIAHLTSLRGTKEIWRRWEAQMVLLVTWNKEGFSNLRPRTPSTKGYGTFKSPHLAPSRRVPVLLLFKRHNQKSYIVNHPHFHDCASNFVLRTAVVQVSSIRV